MLDESVYSEKNKPPEVVKIENAYLANKRRIDKLDVNVDQFEEVKEYLMSRKIVGQKYHNSLDQIV